MVGGVGVVCGVGGMCRWEGDMVGGVGGMCLVGGMCGWEGDMVGLGWVVMARKRVAADQPF